MTTMLTPQGPALPAERTLRFLPIAADLLPVEVVDARRGRLVRKVVLSGVGTFAALMLVWYGQSLFVTIDARGDVAATQDDVQRLTKQQNAYAELVKTQADSKAISDELPRLLANDLQWSTLLGSLRSVAPAGVQLATVTATLKAVDTTTAKVPGSSVEPAMGTITITGNAPNKNSVAAYVDALAKLNGIGNPLLGDALDQDGGVRFTIRTEITKAALGGRYTKSKNASQK